MLGINHQCLNVIDIAANNLCATNTMSQYSFICISSVQYMFYKIKKLSKKNSTFSLDILDISKAIILIKQIKIKWTFDRKN